MDSESKTGVSLPTDQLQLPAYTQTTWIICACWGVYVLPPAFT